MGIVRYVGETALFGKPYCWVLLDGGKLSLEPAPKPAEPQTVEGPFTWDLARAALRRADPSVASKSS